MRKRVKLHFENKGYGFVLEDKAFSGDRTLLEDYELGDFAFYNGNGEVVVMMETFTGSGLHPLNYYIREARRLNIPGRYEVPELGLKDATFVEVLEAVRDYYARKLASRSDSSSEVPAA